MMIFETLAGASARQTYSRRIVRPLDDVDLLAAQLLHDGLHARPAHADARADRIDVAVVRHDGDLRAAARLARRALHLDDALVDLRHLLLGRARSAGPGCVRDRTICGPLLDSSTSTMKARMRSPWR